MPTPLPALTKDSIQLADWIELQALTSGDGSANTGQLERASAGLAPLIQMPPKRARYLTTQTMA